MIMEATLAVKFDLTVDDIIDTVHPFPTFSPKRSNRPARRSGVIHRK